MATEPLALLLIFLISKINGSHWRSAECATGIGECVCSGTYNGRTMAGSDRIEDLRTMYENCTRVRGNLEITHLTSETIHNRSLSEKLKIFQHIEEIKGYLLIYNVDFDFLWFPNLKIIWGDRLFEDHTGSRAGAALMISGNHQLKEIYMPKLRTVHNGDVLIENNTYLCYLKNRVNWNELLNMDMSRFIGGHDAFRDCDSYNFTTCHPSCTENHCWGKSSAYCQHLYRTPCPEQCGSTLNAPQCFFNEAEKQYKCCHTACEGGCIGPLDTDCVACKNFKLNNSCVTNCPPLMINSRKHSKLIRNPNGTYIDDRYCVKECSVNMLIQDGNCVRHCSDGFYHDANKDTRICERCPEEGCPAKACEVNVPLTGEVLATLKGCEVINGFLKITGPLMSRTDTSYTVADLSILKSVRIVSEYVYVVAGINPITNLNFLENLEVIEGRALDTERYAMVVSQNDNLRELGLKKLKRIKAGNIFIRDNHSLCFATTVNWTAFIVPRTSDTNIASNMDEKTCVRRRKVCHSECSETEGCWGMGPEMCVRCANWKLNETCVSHCPSEGYFEDEDTQECKPCFNQCLQCKGPKKSDCLTCKNVSYRENNRLVCMDECTVKQYELGGECFLCHKSCYELGCTGPLGTLGSEGCNACRYALVENDQVERCLFTESSQHQVCEANNLTHHYVSSRKVEGVELVHCSECDDVCKSCNSAGRGVQENGCVCKDYVINFGDKRTCGESCEGFFYEIQPKKVGEPGHCRSCNEACDHNAGCEGATAADCHQCAYASLTINGTDVCVSSCPTEKPFRGHSNGKKICAEEDIDALAKRKRIWLILFGCVLAFFFILAAIFFIYRCRRLGRKLEKVINENLADIPEEIQVTSARPNMNRVHLIARNEAQKTEKKLGSGAFGDVYAGFWYPKGTTGKKVPVAIKVVNAIGKLKSQEEADMLDEAAKMAQCRHLHLLRLIGICMKDDGIELVTPLRALGNLLSYLRLHNEKLPGKYLLIYCYQIASAMKYLAERHLIHRDLAARNVLVKHFNHVEVTDFGLSKFIAYGESEIKIETGKVPIKWIAPEVWDNHTYTSQSDVWSYGVTCWEILTFGESPYKGMDPQSIREYLGDGKRLLPPKNCSAPLYQMILQCWMVDPDSRPTFAVLYERFNEFCKIPNCYVVESSVANSTFHDDDQDQEKELRELMNEEDPEGWDNVENPLTYFDTMDTDSLMGQPIGRAGRRLTSTSSVNHRYHTDPMARPNILSKSMSIGLDDNYMVPDSKAMEHQAILYTPVVVNDGKTERVEMEYYNQKPGSSKDHEYYNDSRFQKQDSVLRKIQEESEEVEKESCL